MNRATAVPALSVAGPNLRHCRRFLEAAATGTAGPGDWQVRLGQARLVLRRKGRDHIAAETTWRILGQDVPLPKWLRRRRVAAVSEPLAPARAWALVLPAVPIGDGDRDFVDQALEKLEADPAPSARALLIVLTDTLRHLPCPPPAFDPIDAWNSLQTGTPLPGPLAARAAQPANWRPVVDRLDRDWGRRLTRLAMLAQERNIAVTILPCCTAGFLGTVDIAALHPYRTGRPFNLSVVAACLAQLATDPHAPPGPHSEGLAL